MTGPGNRRRAARAGATLRAVPTDADTAPTHADKVVRFRALHQGPAPLLLPNPWDPGSAKLLAALGFEALATTSAGFAATLGRLDGRVSLDEKVAHVAAIVAATDLPVSADFEDGFAREPGDVAANVTRLLATGLAGCSIEDFSRDPAAPIHDLGLAVERVAAAAEAAHATPAGAVLTARAENLLHGRTDLADTIARLQAYQEAGADVLYAPGLVERDDIRAVVEAVDRPVNVLALPGCPDVAALAALGVRRISVGSAFASVALGAAVTAAEELRDQGTYGFWTVARAGAKVSRRAFAG